MHVPLITMRSQQGCATFRNIQSDNPCLHRLRRRWPPHEWYSFASIFLPQISNIWQQSPAQSHSWAKKNSDKYYCYCTSHLWHLYKSSSLQENPEDVADQQRRFEQEVVNASPKEALKTTWACNQVMSLWTAFLITYHPEVKQEAYMYVAVILNHTPYFLLTWLTTYKFDLVVRHSRQQHLSKKYTF